MSKKVQYIKIARIDQNGNDQTNTLEALTQITIPFTNSGNKNYTIKTSTRYSTYYLFLVDLDFSPDANTQPLNTTSTTINYDFTGSIEPSTVGPPLSSQFPILFPVTASSGLQVSPLFFDPEAEYLVFNTLPLKDVNITTSNFNVVVANATAEVELYKINAEFTSYERLTNNSDIPAPGTEAITRTATILKTDITPGDIIGLGIRRTTAGGGPGPTVTISNPLGPVTLNMSSTVAAGSTLETIIEPFLNSVFYGGDCDVILNNVSAYRENPFLQDLDYSTNPNIPINFEQIISGTAARGTVPESYYTSLAQTRIRYTGVKNQSRDFNVYNPLDGDDINIGTYGQTPSVSDLDVNIYEFDWGGGTTPEIVNCGAFKLGKMLQVSSKDLVKTINASDGLNSISTIIPFNFESLNTAQNSQKVITQNASGDVITYPPIKQIQNDFYVEVTKSITDYTHILESNLPVGSVITPAMYPNSTAGSNPTIPSSTRVLSNSWGVPTISNFAGTSSNADFYGWILGPQPFPLNGRENYIFLHRNTHFSKVKKNSAGYYVGSKTRVKPNFKTLTNQINDSIRNGGRWYITLYNEFEFPSGDEDFNAALISSSILTPMNDGLTNPNPEDEVEFLASKGVFQIVGSQDSFSNQMIILTTPYSFQESYNLGGVNNYETQTDPGPYTGVTISGSALGFLIWEAIEVNKGEFIIVDDSVTGGVGAGAFTTQFSSEDLTQNFEEITKEYGANTPS
jgi:hypothetical protein